MRSALKTLERIKKFELDEQQRLLRNELEREAELQRQLDSLTECYLKEKEFVMQNPTVCDFGAYTDQYLRKRRSLEAQISDTQQKIEHIRDVMADIFKEQKTYNLIENNRIEAQQKEFDMAEQKSLDEIGTNAYIKKHQD